MEGPGSTAHNVHGTRAQVSDVQERPVLRVSSMSDTGAPTPPTPPALPGPPPTWVAGRGVPVPREAGRLARVLTAFWAERRRPVAASTLVLCGVVGVLGGVLLVGHRPGLGAALIGLFVWAAAAPALIRRRNVNDLVTAALSITLFAVVAVRDAGWVVVLCALAAAWTGVVAVTSSRSAPAAVLAPLTWAAGTVRAMPWVAKGLETLTGSRRGQLLVALRSVGITVGLLLVFGLLFASADRVFARMMPRVDADLLPGQVVVGVLVAVVVGDPRAPRSRTAQLVRRPARTAAGREARRVAAPGACARRAGPALRDRPGRRAARRAPPRAGDRGPHLRRVRAGGVRAARGGHRAHPGRRGGRRPARAPRDPDGQAGVPAGARCALPGHPGRRGVRAAADGPVRRRVRAHAAARLRDRHGDRPRRGLRAAARRGDPVARRLAAACRAAGGGRGDARPRADQPGRADRPPQHHGRPR